MNKSPNNSPFPKIALSAAAAILLGLHISQLVKFDGVSLAILAVAVLPWISSAIQELQIPGILTLRLREVQAEVDALRFLITSLLPRWEFEILDRLNGSAPFPVDTNNVADTFRRDLGDLWGRGFVRQIHPGRYLPSGQGTVDLKDFYAVDALGRQYVALRNRYLSTVNSEANQNETPRSA